MTSCAYQSDRKVLLGISPDAQLAEVKAQQADMTIGTAGS